MAELWRAVAALAPGNEFLQALAQNAFLQNALLAGLLASLACGVVGGYVMARRITYIAGAIAHSVLGGMGAAGYARAVLGWDWAHPLLGATVAALVAAGLIGVVSLRAGQREDTVIGAIWAVGMAVGVLFIARTPGYNSELMSYLFGNILMVSRADLWLMAGLDAVILAVAVLFHNQLVAVCFDEEFARLRGLPVGLHYFLLLALTALTVVLLSTVVGIIMVIALLTLPAGTAASFSRRLGAIMAWAVAIAMLVTSAGLALSFGPDLPTGAVIILLAGALYLAAAGLAWLLRRG
ncbi:ABC-3 protein [Desulfarculus baarsii DSM 2075]|uniref:ABC-3 protein n=1 Tax=Desulfarculus baarsii (strain ATCC 33931 / DSM 2075 / LMG 7858 / VKM B-1802 / 2st14) TaxID=644282 RepID=E1QEJ0_DESB2|nr:metal ABC transporter permease [Desulfarculus baarsii]ADK83976.1 ABC-3 protein [Desulfarculus baarsii DSM 2075]